MRIGFANGCFDTFHSGHAHFLSECRRQCDYLIVAVNHDKSVSSLKGPSRPHDTFAYRCIKVNIYADAVIPFDGYETALIERIDPEVIFRGHDQPIEPHRYLAGNLLANGNERVIVQISQLPGFSTTRILGEAKRDAQISP